MSILWMRYRGEIFGALVIVALLVGTLIAGIKIGANSVRVDWQAEQITQAERVITRRDEVRSIERDWIEQTGRVDHAIYKEMERDSEKADDVVAAVARGDLRLRDEFARCDKRSERLPTTTPAVSVVDGGGGDGLRRTDEAAPLRLAKRANKVVKKLKACQAYVREIQTAPLPGVQ